MLAVHTFTVPPGSIFRVCLASDGLWDVCSFDRAAEVMKKAATVQRAAKDLLRMRLGGFDPGLFAWPARC